MLFIGVLEMSLYNKLHLKTITRIMTIFLYLPYVTDLMIDALLYRAVFMECFENMKFWLNFRKKKILGSVYKEIASLHNYYFYLLSTKDTLEKYLNFSMATAIINVTMNHILCGMITLEVFYIGTSIFTMECLTLIIYINIVDGVGIFLILTLDSINIDVSINTCICGINNDDVPVLLEIIIQVFAVFFFVGIRYAVVFESISDK